MRATRAFGLLGSLSPLTKERQPDRGWHTVWPQEEAQRMVRTLAKISESVVINVVTEGIWRSLAPNLLGVATPDGVRLTVRIARGRRLVMARLGWKQL